MVEPAKLSHVLWIGGSPCAGKSSICLDIARRYVILDYRLDPMGRNHLRRRLAAGDERMRAFLNMSMQQRWVERSVETLVEETVESWKREGELAIEDVLHLPDDWFILVEGNFFPEAIAPLLSSSHQAIWLTPSDDFCKQIRHRRHTEQAERRKQHGLIEEMHDQEKHIGNLIARDCQLAHYVRKQAAQQGLPSQIVDETRSLDEMIRLVEQHFEPYLKERIKQFAPF